MSSDGTGHSVDSSGCGGLADSDHLAKHVVETAVRVERKSMIESCIAAGRDPCRVAAYSIIVSYLIVNTSKVVSAESKAIVYFDIVLNVDWVGAIAENSLSSQIPSSSHVRCNAYTLCLHPPCLT